jgi:hypothetical protein
MRAVKLRYETGTGTLIQFIVLSLLGIPNGLTSIITTCHSNGNECATNSLGSVVFFILTVMWFGAMWAVGYLAQERRSRKLALLLICAELGTALVAFHFNVPHDTNLLTKATSLIDILLSLWVIALAIRLSRSKGGRIVSPNLHNRTRRRPPTPPPAPES